MEDHLTGLLIIGLIAACCGVPVLVAVGLSKFGPRTAQEEGASTSFELGGSQANGLLNENPSSMLKEDEQAGQNN